jgi:two-component system sensor histidine kinase and response regulator WspE
MFDLFRVETENQSQVLTQGLLALERQPAAPEQLEACMRAAHSLKGAARIIGLDAGVTLAHAMEDCFVAAQKQRIVLGQSAIDRLLRGVDLLGRIAHTPEAEMPQWAGAKKPEVDSLAAQLARVRDGEEVAPPAAAETAGAGAAAPAAAGVADADRVLRVTAEHLNRLLGLTAEALVESRWLGPYSQSLLRLKRRQHELGRQLEDLRERLLPGAQDERVLGALSSAQQRALECQHQMSQRLGELELFAHRSSNLAHRLHDEALACRMRPFADGVRGLPRMVRDVARALGKQVRLEIVGEATQVDRDILEKLDAPLGHLLRNAIDHGVEAPKDRAKAGKPAEAVIKLEARHSAGMLQITIADDGRGVDLARLRKTVVERKLTNEATARTLSEAELLEFLFLPGFSLKTTVTDISGRGVGLDVVQNMVKQVRGTVRVASEAGKGMRFALQLPLTLSVVRTLLADIGGEPYAFPLAHIVRTLKLPRSEVESLEGRQHFRHDGRQVGLVSAQQIFSRGEPRPIAGADWPVVVIGERERCYGLIVNGFLGERELVVQTLDPRLGKIKDVSAGGLMEDGAPVLIVDVEDLLRSVEKLAAGGGLSTVQREGAGAEQRKLKRVLVVDDSLTVRELQRKLLSNRGYEVEIAVDGMDGWNAVRTSRFDLVVTDIDMPRMDGIELVSLIKKDPNLKALPVMVVSYKDREQDRRRGLEAGADYYLTKGSFHDETLLQAVTDLIGEGN